MSSNTITTIKGDITLLRFEIARKEVFYLQQVANTNTFPKAISCADNY